MTDACVFFLKHPICVGCYIGKYWLFMRTVSSINTFWDVSVWLFLGSCDNIKLIVGPIVIVWWELVQLLWAWILLQEFKQWSPIQIAANCPKFHSSNSWEEYRRSDQIQKIFNHRFTDRKFLEPRVQLSMENNQINWSM